MKKLIAIAAMIAAFGLGGAAAFAASTEKPPSPPGQGECGHGNTEKPCKEDPQPDRGKDCEAHGNQGGVNEDHCAGGETTPPETTPTTPTTPTETTPTTPTETTPTTATETTSTETASTVTTSTETTPAEPVTTVLGTSVSEEQEEQVSTAVKKEKVESAQSGPESVVAPAAATRPSTAAQAAPFTP